MKKILAIMLTLIMATSCAACTGTETSSAPQATTTATETTTAAPATDDELETLDWVAYNEYNLEEDVPVKNIILMIGDGMGENIIKASEVVKGDKLVMSGMPYNTHVTTHSLSVEKGHIGFTDSAASATALSTGVKTYNQYIGVDENEEPLETICEFAMNKGLKTGLVARHYVCHATPAGMVAHNSARSSYQQILREMINSGVNVMFGGGGQYYKDSKKTRTAVEENNYKYITTEEELLALEGNEEKVLGMFAFDNMGSATHDPQLPVMTEKALDLLDNENGFFLMVEGSNIDVYAAQEDMNETLEQMKSFDESVDCVLRWAEKHPGTFVIVTADHETGGVMVPENAKPEDITDECFTSDGEHTNTNVLVMTAGANSKGLCEQELIDNTDIAKYMRKVLEESHA